MRLFFEIRSKGCSENVSVSTVSKARTAALRCAGFCNLLFSRILHHEARSAVLLGLIEHAVGFSEQVLDLLRENKAVRADAAADRDLLENTGNIAQELRQQMFQLVLRQIYIEHYGKLVTADTADRAAETKGVL